MIRVGFVIDALAPGAGTENQLILLCKRLPSAGIEPALICLQKHPRFAETGLDVPMHHAQVTRVASLQGLQGVLSTASWIRRQKLDVVVTFFRDANLVGTLAGRLAGRPVISSRRNLGYWHTPGERRLLRALRPLTHAYVANSQAVRDHTVATEGIAPERILVLPNAVDTERFLPASGPERAALRSRFSLAPDAVVLLCVANLRPMKGHDTLLRAVATLPQSTLLVLAGEGPEEPALRALAAELGVVERVRFLGRLPDASSWMQAADLGVLASRSESLPNALVEMLASGLPTVATDAGGCVEVLDHGKAGRVVAIDDPEALSWALGDLVAHPDQRVRLGEAGRRRALAVYAESGVISAWHRALSAWAQRGYPTTSGA